jgi:hypothetical protein
MLCGIEEVYRNEALTLLRWLAYAQSPPTLGELAEASIIDPCADVEVDVDNRGNMKDTLNILSALITVQGAGDDDNVNSDEIKAKGENAGLAGVDSEDNSVFSPRSTQRIGKDTKIRLAHFSVKEYLESSRILQRDAKEFFLDSATGHRFLAQSCLTYLIYYSNSNEKTSTRQDLDMFPLLSYAARSWFHHTSLQRSGEVSREISLLSSEDAKHHWLLVHKPDTQWKWPFRPLDLIGSSLYYASFLGLETVVDELLRIGVDVNAQGGYYGNALQAASDGGHEKVVSMLIERGADVNAQGGQYGNVLQAASDKGHEKVVSMLIERGADVNAQGGYYGNALQAASVGGHEKVVSMLIERGADVNDQGGYYGNALQAASVGGHEKVVSMLIERGADVNDQGGRYGNALQAASVGGHEKVVEMLIAKGARGV